jgi:hypothetical protein
MHHSMRTPLFLIVCAAVVLGGCASSKSENAAVTDQDTEIRQSILDALALERELASGPIRTRADLYKIFRKGFHEELAERLTAYYWLDDPDQGGFVRASEPLFSVPDTVELTFRSENRITARLTFGGNLEGPSAWNPHTIDVTMKKDGPIWKILSIGIANGTE